MTILRPLTVSFTALAAITGLAYPFLCTWTAQALFPSQAGGSLLCVDGKVRASTLIAQATEDPRYFWGRPSATPSFPTNAGQSGASTLAASNPALKTAVQKRIQSLRDAGLDNAAPIPQDLITASASGLDPHISPEAALWQIPRIARLRKLEIKNLETLVQKHTEHNAYAPSRVNVTALNAELDRNTTHQKK